jgi:hypothetical protein
MFIMSIIQYSVYQILSLSYERGGGIQKGEATANASRLRKLLRFYVWPLNNQLTDVGSDSVGIGGNAGEEV